MSSQDFRQPARCIISVDGEEISALMPYLVEATIECSRETASVCSLEFDNVRLEDETWAVQDAGVFIPWKTFLIEANFGDYSEEIMRGYVKDIHTDSPEQMGAAKVIVFCQDELALLDREHIRKVWSLEDESMNDGDIVNEICSNDFSVESEAGLTNLALSQDATNIQFLRDRAKANGYELFTREGTLHFKPPQLEEEPQSAIMVYKGERTNCVRIAVQHDGHKPDQVSLIRAADTGTELEEETFTSDLSLLGDEAASSENMGLNSFNWQMPRPGGSSLEEARSRAQAKANEHAWKISAEGELDGTLYGHVLLTHKLVGVYGIGDTYGGNYYVDKVTHVFSQTGYRQAFKLIRNATGQHSEPEGNDALAGVR